MGSNSFFTPLVSLTFWAGAEQGGLALLFLWRSQSSKLWAGVVMCRAFCCVVASPLHSRTQQLSWGPEQGKTLKLLRVTTSAPTSCCSVDREAGVAMWAGGLLKGQAKQCLPLWVVISPTITTFPPQLMTFSFRTEVLHLEHNQRCCLASSLCCACSFAPPPLPFFRILDAEKGMSFVCLPITRQQL